jgi:hypothetical protein
MREDIKDSLDRFGNEGLPTGGFLRAMLEHDLTEAVGRADRDNQRDFQEIVTYMTDHLPSACHGSHEVVEAWIKKKQDERSTSTVSTTKPKIFCFSNVVGGGDGVAYAMAEDGHVLGSHWCSHEGFVSHDLGVTEGSRLDRHEDYKKHYPDGYEMIFVPAREVDTHEGLKKAFELNKLIEVEEEKAPERPDEKEA